MKKPEKKRTPTYFLTSWGTRFCSKDDIERADNKEWVPRLFRTCECELCAYKTFNKSRKTVWSLLSPRRTIPCACVHRWVCSLFQTTRVDKVVFGVPNLSNNMLGFTFSGK